jgi:hypothetical protein
MKHFAGSATSGMHEGYTAVLRAAAVQREEPVAAGRRTHGDRHPADIHLNRGDGLSGGHTRYS